MPTYKGSCHCGDIRFEIVKPLGIERLIDCDCSICTKKGIVHCPVEVEEFTLTKGGDAVALYQFGSGDARHQFCPRCGIHVFGRPRNHPERYTANARCLDDFDTIRAETGIVPFDGRNHPKDNGG
jgi:hypothetical protein